MIATCALCAVSDLHQPPPQKPVTAAVLLIGDELLSGRTRDRNLTTLAQGLENLGIRLREARVVADEQTAIIAAVQALRPQVDHLFTTGGIGPTHDDITALAIARAFDLVYEEHAEALALLEQWYDKDALTPARARMAMMPRGARLIANSVSGAPGFQVENVYVLAGVPEIMAAMFAALARRLTPGTMLHAVALRIFAPESSLAPDLADLQRVWPQVALGSYPRPGVVTVVARSPDRQQAAAVIQALRGRVERLGFPMAEGEEPPVEGEEPRAEGEEIWPSSP